MMERWSRGGHTGHHKSSFSTYKQVHVRMVILNDLPMLSYYVIYFEKFRKIMQRTEKAALTCFSWYWCAVTLHLHFHYITLRLFFNFTGILDLIYSLQFLSRMFFTYNFQFRLGFCYKYVFSTFVINVFSTLNMFIQPLSIACIICEFLDKW